MKILKIFGAVVAVHLVAFLVIFASPGCQSGPRDIPTPDATAPARSASDLAAAPAAVPSSPVISYSPPPADNLAEPTRPGSPNAAAIAPVAAATAVTSVTSYIVQRGDSLWSIAKHNSITVSELAKANGFSTGQILQPGRKLLIPGKPVAAATPRDLAAVPAATPAEKPVRATAESGTHVVMSGESLGTIARRYQVTVGELAAANRITDPSKIRVGQKLTIPGSASVGKASSKAAPVTKSAAAAPQEKPTESAATTAPSGPAESVGTPMKFDLTPPPPGKDLDAGLPENATEVPTIKIEPAAP